MADPAGILLHLKLTHAVGEVLMALTGKAQLPGTLAEQEAEVIARTERLANAYNASLLWAKAAGAALTAAESRGNRHQRRAEKAVRGA